MNESFAEWRRFAGQLKTVLKTVTVTGRALSLPLFLSKHAYFTMELSNLLPRPGRLTNPLIYRGPDKELWIQTKHVLHRVAKTISNNWIYCKLIMQINNSHDRNELREASC